jgi:Icc-related predicted phosphoesterase
MVTKRWRSRGKVVWLTASLGLLGCGARPMRCEPIRSQVPDREGSILVIGDTQQTYWAERVFLFREQNDSQRQRLFRRMEAEVRPAYVVHLGDMVSYGASETQWANFDSLFARLMQNVRVYPTLGNHDYWGSDDVALEHVRKRFSELKPRTYYSLERGALGWVFLDSNLRDEDAARQDEWLGPELDRLDNLVEGIIFVTHHPPFTLGEQRENQRFEDKTALELFFKHKKAVLFVSGHVHGYERFAKLGRTFVVSGGGGGPRVAYHDPDEASAQDPDLKTEYTRCKRFVRPLHYVVLSQTAGALHGTVKYVPDDESQPEGVLDEFEVPLHPPDAGHPGLKAGAASSP